MISVGVDASEARLFFRRLESNAGDLKPALERVTDSFLDDEEQHFATRGSGTWRPLNPRYEEWRIRKGKGTQLLRYRGARGGRIFKSLTQRSAKYQQHHVGNDRMTLATTLGIAAKLDRGFSRTKRYPNGKTVRLSIPARSLTNVSADTRRRYAAIVQQHLTEER